MSTNSIIVDILLNYQQASKNIDTVNKKIGSIGKNAPTTEISKTTQALNNLGLAGNSVGGIFGKLFAKVGVWLGITSIVYGLIRGVGSLFSEMKNLEDATIRLQRVMDGTDDVIQKNTKQAYAFAKSMNLLASATYDETIDALEEAVKAGFRFSDAMLVARTALLASNVTEIKAADATRYLVATIRQFNLNANDSLYILDQWNELGQKTGATTQGVAESVVRSAKAFQTVGGTLAQLNAISAAVIESTGQSGEKVGTMLKTLSARYADINKKMSLNNELSKIGIRIQDANTKKQKGIYEVLYETSRAWKDLSEETKSNIAKAAAGVRQYSYFIGIVDNFESSINALLISLNSHNSALDENEKRVKSLDFAMGRLKGTFQEVALSSTGWLTLMTNLTTIFAKFLAVTGKLISNPFSTWLVTTTILFGALYLIFNKFILMIYSRYTPALVLMATGHKAVAISMLSMKVGLAGVGAALLAFLTPVNIALIAVAGLSAWFLTAGTNARKMREEITQAYSTSATDTQSQINNLKELRKNTELFLRMYNDPKISSKTKKNISKTYENLGITSFSSGDLNKIYKDIDKSLSPSEIINKYIETINKKIKLPTKELEWFKNLSKLFDTTNEKDLQKVYKLIENDVDNLQTRLANTKSKLKEFNEKKGFINFSPTDLKKLEAEEKVLESELERKTVLKSILITEISLNDEIDEYRISVEQIQSITKGIYKNFVEALLDLKEGNTVLGNIQNALTSIGNSIYTEIKDSIVDGFVMGMEEITAMKTLKESIQTFSQKMFLDINKWFDSLNQPDTLKKGVIIFNHKGEEFSKVREFKTKGIKWGDMLKTGLLGAGLGGFAAGTSGKDAGQGAMLGSIGSLLGSQLAFLGPFGAIAGGLLGGLLAPSNKQDTDTVVDESLKYQRESTKELKDVNRNLVLMRQELRPWEYISDSYFFSQANTRGYIGA